MQNTLHQQGAGKTFSLELCLKKLGVTPVCLSAGELEDEWAGEPGRRLRERYAFAGAIILQWVHANAVAHGTEGGTAVPRAEQH